MMLLLSSRPVDVSKLMRSHLGKLAAPPGKGHTLLLRYVQVSISDLYRSESLSLPFFEGRPFTII